MATRQQIKQIRVLAKNLPFLASTRICKNERPAKFLWLSPANLASIEQI